MSTPKKKQNKKFPNPCYLIMDVVSLDLWGPEGWFCGDGEILVYESRKEAKEAFAKIKPKKLCAEIIEYNKDAENPV